MQILVLVHRTQACSKWRTGEVRDCYCFAHEGKKREKVATGRNLLILQIKTKSIEELVLSRLEIGISYCCEKDRSYSKLLSGCSRHQQLAYASYTFKIFLCKMKVLQNLILEPCCEMHFDCPSQRLKRSSALENFFLAVLACRCKISR